MKFQNCILINFVTAARMHTHTEGQAESKMPLQFFQSWGKNSTCDPLKCIMDRPIHFVSIYMGKSNRIQRVEYGKYSKK